ncbi:MAG: Preprotein translocase secY subunit, partial [Myxococcaceae bacterium]|nr:Preprotein translocase secY subunit [Myxococcaceae bacterium]
LAAFQAYGVALALQNMDLGGIANAEISVPIATVSLMAGFAVSFLAARFVTQHGLVNGFVLLASVEAVRATIVDLARPDAGLRDQLVPVVACLAVVLATWAALRGAGDVPAPPVATGDEANAPYRDARALVLTPWVPIPSSSVQPFTLAASMLMLPAVLGSAKIDAFEDLGRALSSTTTWTIALLLSTWLGAFVLARLLHRPKEMADLVNRLGASSNDTANGASAALRRALPPTLLYFTVIVLAAVAVSRTRAQLSIAVVPVVTALAMDLVRALRIYSRRRAPLVPVWEERRAAAVPLLRAVLASEGIPCEPRGMAFLTLAQVFAPYAPAELLVKEEHAARASAVLAHLVAGAEKPEREEPDPEAQVKPTKAWPLPQRFAVLAVALLGACGAFALAVVHLPVPAAERGPAAKLELTRVDDTIDPFEHVTDAALPEGEGISILIESIPAGRGHTARPHYARIMLRDGESAGSATARLVRWVDAQNLLTDGARFAYQDVEDFDEETQRSHQIGVRTIVLVGEPILRTADVVDAVAVAPDNRHAYSLEASVQVTLSPESAARFEDATRGWVDRRIAILIDDKVNSAPVVKSAIGGGHISITMGSAGDPALHLVEAKRLARALGGD